jgi:hypothetical protein
MIDRNSSVANTAKVDEYRLNGSGSYNLDATTEVNFRGGMGMNNIRGQQRSRGAANHMV